MSNAAFLCSNLCRINGKRGNTEKIQRALTKKLLMSVFQIIDDFPRILFPYSVQNLWILIWNLLEYCWKSRDVYCGTAVFWLPSPHLDRVPWLEKLPKASWLGNLTTPHHAAVQLSSLMFPALFKSRFYILPISGVCIMCQSIFFWNFHQFWQIQASLISWIPNSGGHPFTVDLRLGVLIQWFIREHFQVITCQNKTQAPPATLVYVLRLLSIVDNDDGTVMLSYKLAQLCYRTNWPNCVIKQIDTTNTGPL